MLSPIIPFKYIFLKCQHKTCRSFRANGIYTTIDNSKIWKIWNCNKKLVIVLTHYKNDNGNNKSNLYDLIIRDLESKVSDYPDSIIHIPHMFKTKEMCDEVIYIYILYNMLSFMWRLRNGS
jgi:hypothetical protein